MLKNESTKALLTVICIVNNRKMPSLTCDIKNDCCIKRNISDPDLHKGLYNTCDLK